MLVTGSPGPHSDLVFSMLRHGEEEIEVVPNEQSCQIGEPRRSTRYKYLYGSLVVVVGFGLAFECAVLYAKVRARSGID